MLSSDDEQVMKKVNKRQEIEHYKSRLITFVH